MEKYYNEICGITFVNIFTKSKNAKEIILSPFDVNNEEHLFVLSVAIGLRDIVKKKIVLDAPRKVIKQLNKAVIKEVRYKKMRKKDKNNSVDTTDLLELMRPWAGELCGCTGPFDFGAIYRAFYKKEEE